MPKQTHDCAIMDLVPNFKKQTKPIRVFCGAGASELQLDQQLEPRGRKCRRLKCRPNYRRSKRQGFKFQNAILE